MNEKLDSIYAAFKDYIQGQNYFDVVYSEKIGYLKILVEYPEGDGPELLDTPEKMLSVLFREIIDSVKFSPENPLQYHEELYLTAYEETESRRRITAILETMINPDKSCYLAYLDTYLKEYKEQYGKRE